MNSEIKKCQNCHQNFAIEPEDFNFYEKISVPPPTFCPGCRFQRRIALRNERKLYRNISGKSGQKILALTSPEAGVNVYEEKEWWSDSWDGTLYGRDYDFSKSFFQQFYELSKVVPRFNRSIVNSVNSEYCGNAGSLKNCYLIFNSNHDEDCAYGNGVDFSKDCYDNSHVKKCERCYHSFWLQNCYKTHFSSQCEDCTEVWLSKNLRGCSNCFGCINLSNKKHHIFNKPYAREDYKKNLAEMKLETWSGLRSSKGKVTEFWLKFPNKYLQGIKNLNVSGEYITHSKNIKFGYLIREGENLKYVQYFQTPPNKDCYDCTVWGEGNELGYENAICGLGVYNSKFCFESWGEIENLEYCGYSSSCSDCFGCFGLRNKKFCILNKQYGKEEYEEMRKKIIAQMNEIPYVDSAGRVYKYGEFFPIEHSPHGYNNTIAIEHFPINKEIAIKNGYKWNDIIPTEYETDLNASNMADSIDEIDNGILNKIIQCEDCKRAYRIIPSELKFLKSEKIAPPRMCVDCRHKDRISQRNGWKIYKRNCTCIGTSSQGDVYANGVRHFHGQNPCPNEFETSYSPDRSEIVYCEQCYNTEIA